MCNNVNKVVADAKSGFYDHFHPVLYPKNEMVKYSVLLWTPLTFIVCIKSAETFLIIFMFFFKTRLK